MKICLLWCLLVISHLCNAQFLMDMVDTTKDLGKSVLSVSKRFDNIRLGGYIQPQFQYAGEKGAKGFAGGDFAPYVNNRYMIRRGRIRFDYVHFNLNSKPSVQFVFQFDGSERGVFIRDFWGRLFENKFRLFAFTTGMFARPFSYELNLASSDRESPERGRMSQVLMKTERDMGAMITFEPRRKNGFIRYVKADAGLFNGPGLSAPADYDSHKDFITRVALKPYPVLKNVNVSFGLSYLDGGILQITQYRFATLLTGAGKVMAEDSSVANIGKIAPRKYYGADFQVKIRQRAGFTEFRAELMQGRQSAFSTTSETPAALLPGFNGAVYIRHFMGAYFYLLHNFINPKNQLAIKFDWYDPNTAVKGTDIGKSGANLNEANIKYTTLGVGYLYYINENVKLVCWFDTIRNESTSLAAYTHDVKDDVLTLRLQFRF